ncbi:hypothetical protein HDV05_007799 [Chytridiales sp. JEL 0842]|nr:hypothetical protein HDV05_007799 [Chytridiales sp. JEL 0842]
MLNLFRGDVPYVGASATAEAAPTGGGLDMEEAVKDNIPPITGGGEGGRTRSR